MSTVDDAMTALEAAISQLEPLSALADAMHQLLHETDDLPREDTAACIRQSVVLQAWEQVCVATAFVDGGLHRFSSCLGYEVGDRNRMTFEEIGPHLDQAQESIRIFADALIAAIDHARPALAIIEAAIRKRDADANAVR